MRLPELVRSPGSRQVRRPWPRAAASARPPL